MSAVTERDVPAALWTGSFLRYRLAEGCSRDWDHKWPEDRKHIIQRSGSPREVLETFISLLIYHSLKYAQVHNV